MKVKITSTVVEYGIVSKECYRSAEPIVFAGEKLSFSKASKRVINLISNKLSENEKICVLDVYTVTEEYEVQAKVIIENGVKIEKDGE